MAGREDKTPLDTSKPLELRKRNWHPWKPSVCYGEIVESWDLMISNVSNSAHWGWFDVVIKS